MSDLKQLEALVVKFRDDRNWKQFHTPKDLALSLSLEAAELLELFQWKTEAQEAELLKNVPENFRDELADVLWVLLMLAHEANVDVMKELSRKLVKTAQRYPIEGVVSDLQGSVVDMPSLMREVVRVSDERGWSTRQTAKDLAMDIVAESSEVLELFLWQALDEQVAFMAQAPEPLRDELADVLHALLRLAHMANVDLVVELKRKIEKTAQKYPVEKAYGKSSKYTDL